MPYCDSPDLNAIEELSLVHFDRLVMGHISQVDFTGYYTFPYSGLYSSYCGELVYYLDPDVVSSDPYLTYDGAFGLTLTPLKGVHVDGTV